MPNTVLTRVLVVAIAVQLGLGTVALATVDEGTSSPLAAEGDAATGATHSSSPALGGDAGDTGDARSSGREDGAQAEDGGAPGPATGVEPADQDPRGPRLGTYRYRTSSTTTSRSSAGTNSKESSGEITYRLHALAPQNGEVRVRRLTEGTGGWTDNAYRRDGQYVMGTGGHSEGQSTECDWEPDILAVRWRAVPGARWNVDSRCTSSSDGATSEVHEKGTITVVGTKRLTIGGREVDTQVLEKRTATTVTSRSPQFAEPFTFTYHEETTFHYATGHRLNVLQETVNRGSDQFRAEDGTTRESQRETRSRAELVSLDPT